MLFVESSCHVPGGFAAVIYGNGSSTELAGQFHARHVGFPVAEINHVGKGDSLFFLRHGGVYLLAVVDVEDALVYLEKKLSLVGVVHGRGRPDCAAVLVVIERTGEDGLEFL